MQTLWNRIVQSKRARKFSACFSSAAACSRRTTTAVFKRRLSSKDRFTALYSSLLTVATLLDSEIKGGKRRKLLGAIEEAREELRVLDTSQKSRLAALSADCDDIKELALVGRRTWKDVLRWADQEEGARNALGLKDWKGIPLSILEGLSTVHLEDAFRKNSILRKQLLGAEPTAHTSHLRTPKKKKIMEWTTAKLAYRFLREVYRRKTPPNSFSDALKDGSNDADKKKQPLLDEAVQADSILAQVRKLAPHSEAVENLPSPEAPRYTLDHKFNARNVALLNSSLNELFQLSRKEGKNLKFLLINVYNHLLNTNTPPNIQTYTTLARNFEMLGEHQLVKAVFESMDECNVRCDEEALAFWLDYYAKTNQLEDFQNLVNRIHGFHNRISPAYITNIVSGIAFRQYWLRSYGREMFEKLSNGRDSLALKTKFLALRYEKLEFMVFRTACKNQDVYRSLISGSFKFFGNQKAMGHYINMISEGYEPTIEILTSILHQCCNTKDWESGLMAVQKTIAITGGKGSSHSYRWLLRLCEKCRDVQEFKKVLADGVRHGAISPAVQNFPEQINAAQADQLLDLASEYDELLQLGKVKKPVSQPFEKLCRWLGVIGHQMAATAFDFGVLALSAGHSPANAYFSYTRIKYNRADFLDWVEEKLDRSAEDSQDVLGMSPRHQIVLQNAPKGRDKPSNGIEVPSLSRVVTSSVTSTATRFREKYSSMWNMWDPLLFKLLQDFRRMERLMSNLAWEFGNIELSIKHGPWPSIGHLLDTKIVLWKGQPLESTELTLLRHSSGNGVKHEDRVHSTIQALENNTLKSQNTSCQGEDKGKTKKQRPVGIKTFL